jgi:hypothetical protein
MSDYKTEYALRYTLTNVHQQIEVATVVAAGDIITEDPGTANHVDRLNWAHFVMGNSVMAYEVMKWPVAANPAIQTSVQEDPTGNSVSDNDVQFVVNSNIELAVEAYKTSPYYRPPPTT